MKKRMWKLRPVRLLCYLLLVGMTVLLYGILRSTFLMILLVCMGVLPVVSLVVLCMVTKHSKITAGTDRTVCRQRENVQFCLCIQNPLWVGLMDCRLQIRVENVFRQKEEQIEAAMPAAFHQNNEMRIMTQMHALGKVQIRVESAWFQGIMGIVCLRQQTVEAAADVAVLPVQHPSGEDWSEGLQGSTDTMESSQKGSDYAQISDIRAYRPGDRMRDVHWKLSARQDDLLVKERVAMAGETLTILIDLPQDIKGAEEVLSYTYSMCCYWTMQNVPVQIACWDQPDLQFVLQSCSTTDDVDQALIRIVSIDHRLHVCDRAITYMNSCYPYLQTYLIVSQKDGKVQWGIQENDI